MAKALDGKDYQLVITGHSLGAGTASLIGLKLKDRFPGKQQYVSAAFKQIRFSCKPWSWACNEVLIWPQAQGQIFK